MQHSVSISFENDIYSVTLASQDVSDGFGIWDVTAGEALVPYGTSVSESSDKTYSYDLTVENGHSYLVSWEIVANDGEDPYYQIEQIGPFFSLDDTSVRACASFQGTFAPGFLCTLLLKVTSFMGNPTDPDGVTVEIYSEEGVMVPLSSNVPDKASVGFYAFDWIISNSQELGKYYVVWNYTVDGIPKAEVQEVVVSSKDNSSVLYSGRYYAAIKILETYVGCCQYIPIYFEQAKPSRDNKTYRFTFGKWNQSPGVKIYRNKNIVNEGVEIDYFEGKVTFDEELTMYDTVFADYNFSWFSDEQLAIFLENAVNELNSFPPGSRYNISSLPDRFITGVIYGAARDAIRQLLMCIQFQEPAQIFGGSEGAQKAFSNFDTLKQNYEKSWERILDNKKFGPYPMPRIISTPEYTMPGGRSRWFRMLFKN